MLGDRARREYAWDTDKPKQRGTNKPKSMSPGRQQNQSAKESGARVIADKSRHSGGSKPRAPRGR